MARIAGTDTQRSVLVADGSSGVSLMCQSDEK